MKNPTAVPSDKRSILSAVRGLFVRPFFGTVAARAFSRAEYISLYEYMIPRLCDGVMKAVCVKAKKQENSK